jgi:membrane-associated protease RseP (regulator of RpoE activity)
MLLLVAAAAICTVVHVGMMALAGWYVGATVEEVCFFLGPWPIRFCYRGVNFRIGAIPLGGYVKFKGDQDKPKDADEILFAADAEPPAWWDLHPVKRVVTLGSGCVALMVLAALCLGPWGSVRSTGRGFVQVAPFAPWAPAWVPSGGELVERFVSLLRDRPFRVGLGVLAAKVAAANLLPLASLNGGMIVAYLAAWRRRLPENVEIAWTCVGFGVLLILWVYWLVQIAGVLLKWSRIALL